MMKTCSLFLLLLCAMVGGASAQNVQLTDSLFADSLRHNSSTVFVWVIHGQNL